MSVFLSPQQAEAASGRLVILDVRKPAARLASGKAISGAVWKHPFDALNWRQSLSPGNILVYCVHGHEVSQAVAGFLRDSGRTCFVLEGGFEAWTAAGLATEPIGSGHD